MHEPVSKPENKSASSVSSWFLLQGTPAQYAYPVLLLWAPTCACPVLLFWAPALCSYLEIPWAPLCSYPVFLPCILPLNSCPELLPCVPTLNFPVLPCAPALPALCSCPVLPRAPALSSLDDALWIVRWIKFFPTISFFWSECFATAAEIKLEQWIPYLCDKNSGKQMERFVCAHSLKRHSPSW